MVGACGRRVVLSMGIVVFNLSQSELSHSPFLFLLYRSFNVRRATTDDVLGVKMLVKTLSLNENILNDLERFNLFRRDPVSTCCKYTYKRMDRYWAIQAELITLLSAGMLYVYRYSSQHQQSVRAVFSLTEGSREPWLNQLPLWRGQTQAGCTFGRPQPALRCWFFLRARLAV